MRLYTFLMYAEKRDSFADRAFVSYFSRAYDSAQQMFLVTSKHSGGLETMLPTRKAPTPRNTRFKGIRLLIKGQATQVREQEGYRKSLYFPLSCDPDTALKSKFKNP